MEREVIVCGDEARNKMVLEGLDGPFGGISPVQVGWDQLETLMFLQHVIFEVLGAFVVKDMHLWVQSPGAQQVPDFW